MALTTDRIVGHQVTVTIGDSVTEWQEITITEDEDESDAKASDSDQRATVRTASGISGKVTGFLGVVNNGSTLPVLGDTIDSANIKVAVGSDQVMEAFTGYDNVKVVGPKTYNWKNDSATFEWNFKSGRLN